MLSRTRTLTYGNGASVSFDYEPDSDLKEIVHTRTVTQYLVSADHVIAEYDGPGDLASATLLQLR